MNLLIFCFHRVRGYIKGSAELENRGREMVKMLQNDLYKISRGKLKCEKMSHFDEENWKERGKPEQWARKLRWSASSGFVLFSTVPPQKIHDQLQRCDFWWKAWQSNFQRGTNALHGEGSITMEAAECLSKRCSSRIIGLFCQDFSIQGDRACGRGWRGCVHEGPEASTQVRRRILIFCKVNFTMLYTVMVYRKKK